MGAISPKSCSSAVAQPSLILSLQFFSFESEPGGHPSESKTKRSLIVVELEIIVNPIRGQSHSRSDETSTWP